jgi:DNA-binding PadR family transcriptional regulator
MKLTERDIGILKFINEFGFSEMPQIERRFGLKKPRSYQLLTRLVEEGYVKHERVFHGRHGIYRLSRKGAKLTHLPPLARVPLANYKHDITLMEVYLRLREDYPEASWISERELKRDKYFDGVGKFGHLSDGLLVFKDGKRIAVEVELSLKSRNRVEQILRWYGGVFEIEEVWYYCPKGIMASMSSMAVEMPHIKFNDLDEFLREPKAVSGFSGSSGVNEVNDVNGINGAGEDDAAQDSFGRVYGKDKGNGGEVNVGSYG